MSCDLLRDYLLEKAAYLFREQVWQKVYDADSNDIENVIKIAKQRGVKIPDPERFLEMEKQWLSPEGPVFNYRPLGSFEESCLAVLAMLPPDLMEEYFLDSFNYLKDTIETIQNEKMPLTDRSLVIIAEDFLKRERLSRRPHVADRILVLRKWPWLRHELGDEKTEKLVKIIYYFWQTNKAQTAKTKVEGKLEAAEPEIHVLTDEERRQEIERIVRESQKISFSKLQKESLQ
jgi:hypothetical protein